MATLPNKSFPELLDDYYQRLSIAQTGHYSQSETLRFWHLAISTVLIVCSTVVGAFLFFDYVGSSAWVRSVITLSGLLAALLAALQPQLRLAATAESYRIKAVQYGRLRREVEVFIASSETSSKEQREFLNDLTQRWDEVAADALVTPKAIRDLINNKDQI